MRLRTTTFLTWAVCLAAVTGGCAVVARASGGASGDPQPASWSDHERQQGYVVFQHACALRSG